MFCPCGVLWLQLQTKRHLCVRAVRALWEGCVQANWMKKSGIKKGDAVAIYLPMVERNMFRQGCSLV